MLIGEGPGRRAIERHIDSIGMGDRIRVHGQVLETRDMIGSVDVVVQSSVREGLPNAVLEAAAAGRAIVATDAGGTAEIVVDGSTGLLVPTEDRPALARGLSRLIDDAALRQRLGSAARVHVADLFDMDRYVSEFADLYAGLIEATRRRKSRRWRRT